MHVESKVSVLLKESVTDLRLSCSQGDMSSAGTVALSFFVYVKATGTKIAKLRRYVPNSL